MTVRFPSDHAAWAAACVTFVVGDVATTAVGAATPGVTEVHPLAADVLHAAGVPGLFAVKAAAMLVFAALYVAAPDDWNVGVPLSLALLGTALTLHNAAVIAAAHPGFLCPETGRDP